MAYEQKDGEGTLFQNDKQGNEKRPDWTGKILLAGEWYKLAAWERQGRSGPFLSIKGEPQGQGTSQRLEKEVQKSFPEAKAGPVKEFGSNYPNRQRGLDDEVPF